jgi:hypothetical protein
MACATPASDKGPPPAASDAAAATHPSTTQERPMTSTLEGRALPGARTAVDHLLAFLATLDSTAALKPERLGRAFGVQLGPDTTNGAGWTVYHSADLGQGWSYWVQQSDARPSMKNGFRFWFDHSDRTADASPVCALPLDRLRSTLTQHGWVERPVPSEIGSILAVEFSKNDVVLTLTPRDGTDIDGTACVLAIQTTDGH